MTPNTELELQRIDRMAGLLDARFRVPVIGLRIGLDGILGFVPGLGDVITLGPAVWILWKGYRLGAPKRVLVRMGANSAADVLIGSIPLVGDLFDIGFKANLRNARLLRNTLAPRRLTDATGSGAHRFQVNPTRRIA